MIYTKKTIDKVLEEIPMARIPDDELERLKQTISLQRLAEARGITLKCHGADLIGLCPFHDDKAPSLVISPKKNLWHCLGACQTGGTVIDWVMKSEGVSFRYAVELLQQNYQPTPLAAKKSSPPPKTSSIQRLPVALEPTADDQILLNQVIDYYHATLKQSPEALAYLKKRGLADEAAIETFKLGFSNRTLGYRVPKASRQIGAELRGRLQSLGILRDSGHEHFNGSLVVPVFQGTGVVEVYGRKVNDNLRAGTPKHLYLPGPHQGLFNIDALERNKEIILCESLIDALTFWVAGFKNVTASYGIEGFTPAHLDAFKQYKIERVLIAYDRDQAGGQAAAALAEKLIKEGIDCYRIAFPKNMDANEYALSVQPASKSLGVVIRSAIWLGKGKAPVKPKSQPVHHEQKETAPKRKTDPSSSFTAPAHPAPAALARPCASAAEPISPEDKTQPPAKPLPAAVIPEAPQAGIEAEVSDEEVIINLGGEPRHPASGSHKAIPGQNRRYRIRGLNKNLSIHHLKVNVLVSKGDALHVDTFDLYAARSRGLFIKQVALELDMKDTVIKKDLGQVLLKLEALQETQINQTLKNKNETQVLDDDSRADALALLKSPDLMQRILNDFDRCGVVGEQTNKLIGYLACVSRKLDKPLAVIIQSTSAAGKSVLMDAILTMMPAEERVQYSAMTGQSLFYMGETNLKNKILAISEEEGASTAGYALKLLQSEGVITIASTGKDDSSGDLVTKEYRVEGPVMLFLTTTAIDIDEELMNRCLILTVNESREQTQAIHALQRKQQTLDGLLQNEERKHLIQVHRNAQHLLRPLLVANPFAEQLTFVDDKTRTRRDHMKYLTLINTIALLHQHQREIKTARHHGQALEYIEVIQADIKTANRLAHEVLGRTLDELPPQTFSLLKHLHTMVNELCQQQSMSQRDVRFSRRDIRDHTRWSDGQLKIHCRRLTDLEYLLVHRGGRGQSLVYELLYDGELDDKKHLMGLIDPEILNSATVPDVALPPASMQSYDENKLGQSAQKTAPSQGQVSPKSGGSQGGKNNAKHCNSSVLSHNDATNEKNSTLQKNNNGTSYRNPNPALAAEGHG